MSSKVLKNISEIIKNIPGNVKTFIFVVNKSISYLLFRFYTKYELMIKADAAMRTARTERSELGQQFLIPHPEENSWGRIEFSTKKESSVSSLRSLLL